MERLAEIGQCGLIDGVESENQVKQHRKRRRNRFLLVLAVIAVATLFGTKWLLPTHPAFGAIREATAYNLNEAENNRLAAFLRKHLPSQIVQSPNFPDRFKYQARPMQLGPHQMEWVGVNTSTGWLCFCGISRTCGLVNDKWEFAPCTENNLMTVTNVPTFFYASTNAELKSIFGADSTIDAIKVFAGQILYARPTDDPRTVYILKLEKQDLKKLVVRYCITTKD